MAKDHLDLPLRRRQGAKKLPLDPPLAIAPKRPLLAIETAVWPAQAFPPPAATTA